MLLPTSVSRKPSGNCMIFATAADVCAAVGMIPCAVKREFDNSVAQVSKLNESFPLPLRPVSMRIARVATIPASPPRESNCVVS